MGSVTHPIPDVFENISLSVNLVLYTAAQTVENFFRTWSQTVSVAIDNLCTTIVYDSCIDATACHPPGNHESSRSSTNDNPVLICQKLVWSNVLDKFPSTYTSVWDSRCRSGIGQADMLSRWENVAKGQVERSK
jgi:hypothetical protein